jgi:membrane protein YdbS with pleckstrin-like domain
MVAPAVRLNPDEKIVLDVLPSVFWTAQLYLGTLGLWAIWRRRHHFLLTNQRVMMVLGIVNKHERSVPLSRIQDISLHRSLLEGGHVALSSAGGSLGIERIGPLTRNGAREFADALSELLRVQHGDGVSTPPVAGSGAYSVAEELGRLAALRDSGVLTEDEFAAQKTKLLG